MRSLWLCVGLLLYTQGVACQGILGSIANGIRNIFGDSSNNGNTAPSPAASQLASLGGTFVQLRNLNPYIAGELAVRFKTC